MTKDWIVRPITLVGDQELVLEDGVVITAKRGEYRGGGDTVLTARDISNLTIRGYGATVRMRLDAATEQTPCRLSTAPCDEAAEAHEQGLSRCATAMVAGHLPIRPRNIEVSNRDISWTAN